VQHFGAHRIWERSGDSAVIVKDEINVQIANIPVTHNHSRL
jgi:hypothetical protein